MPEAPVHKLKKQEILWLSDHKCIHRHSYLSHYSCFLREVADKNKWEPGSNIPIPHRVGFFDIEASGLKANFGIMLCYCIKDSESDKIYEYCISKKEMEKDLDKKVIQHCVEDLSRFDRIVTYFGSRFDFPFTRTRAVYHNLYFPHYKELLHTDLFFVIRNRFSLGRKSLESAYNMLVGESHKTHYGRDYWVKALTGNEEALSYILDHCHWDVRDLEELYNKVEGFSMRRDLSI